MPPKAVTLSAVARRRLQKPQQQTPPVEADVTAVEDQSPAAATLTSSAVKSASKLGRRSRKRKIDAEVELEDGNAFAALADISRAPSTGSREIEQLNEHTIKVRLSRGQRCVASGVYSVWVKDGQISIYGAKLGASTKTYQVYALRAYPLPRIEALSRSVEVELSSLSNGITASLIRQAPRLFSKFSAKEAQAIRTFKILGFDADDQGPTTYRVPSELNTDQVENQVADIIYMKHEALTSDSAYPRALIFGRKTSGLSSRTRCVLNSLVTQMRKDELTYPNGILFLDLDLEKPEFAPLGSISLVHIQRPVFGPRYTHKSNSELTDIEILKMHFVGASNCGLSSHFYSALEELMNSLEGLDESLSHCPLIIAANTNFLHLDQSSIAGVWNKINPTHILRFDQKKSWNTSSFWSKIANEKNVQIQNYASVEEDPQVNEDRLDVLIYLQCSKEYQNATAISELPFWLQTQNEQIFTYTVGETDIAAIFVQSDSISLQDTFEATNDAIVAILRIDLGGLSTGWQIGRSQEQLPRVMTAAAETTGIPPSHSELLGLGYISGIDIEEGLIHIKTPVDRQLMEKYRQDGYKIGLVVPEVTRKGRFSPDWMFPEATDGSHDPSSTLGYDPSSALGYDPSSSAEDREDSDEEVAEADQA